MTLNDIFSLNRGIGGLAKHSFDQKTSWDLLKLNRQIRPHVEDFQNRNNAIIETLAPSSRKVEAGTPEHAEFTKQIEELLKVEVDDIKLIQIPMSVLTDAKVNLETLDLLFPIIVE
jgi:hypothetical protein